MEYPSLLLLLVLAASTFSVKSQCPSAEDIYPCKCKVDFIMEEMEVECRDSSTSLNDLKTALSHFSKEEEIYSLKLYYLNLSTIPSNLFEGISVKQMSIYHCDIDFENGKPPLKGLEDSLQVLTIDSSLTHKNAPPYLKLGHLKELETLELLRNQLTELRDDIFDDEMPYLYSLVLRDNLIEKIGGGAFDNLINVKYFRLIGNKLGSLRRNMLPTSTQLIRLYLDYNGLTDLPDDLFTSMPSLDAVTLKKNKLKTINRGTFETILKQDTVILLDDNPIQCDSGMDWLINSSFSPYSFSGKCAGPRKEKGLDISEFISNGRKEA